MKICIKSIIIQVFKLIFKITGRDNKVTDYKASRKVKWRWEITNRQLFKRSVGNGHCKQETDERMDRHQGFQYCHVIGPTNVELVVAGG